MTNLPQALFASLLLQRRRTGETRRDVFAAPGYDRDDLQAARERARPRR